MGAMKIGWTPWSIMGPNAKGSIKIGWLLRGIWRKKMSWTRGESTPREGSSHLGQWWILKEQWRRIGVHLVKLRKTERASWKELPCSETILFQLVAPWSGEVRGDDATWQDPKNYNMMQKWVLCPTCGVARHGIYRLQVNIFSLVIWDRDR